MLKVHASDGLWNVAINDMERFVDFYLILCSREQLGILSVGVYPGIFIEKSN